MANFDIGLNKKTASLLLAAVFLLAFDRFFKILALNGGLPKLNILSDLFTFNFAKNYYIAFSLPLHGPFLSIFISILILVLIFYLAKYWTKKNKAVSIALFFVILGASSNLFDRIKYGFVIDYFDLRYFTVFNIADSMISLAVLFLAYFLIFKEGD